MQIGLLIIKGEKAPDTEQIGVVSTSEVRICSAQCNCLIWKVCNIMCEKEKRKYRCQKRQYYSIVSQKGDLALILIYNTNHQSSQIKSLCHIIMSYWCNYN